MCALGRYDYGVSVKYPLIVDLYSSVGILIFLENIFISGESIVKLVGIIYGFKHGISKGT